MSNQNQRIFDIMLNRRSMRQFLDKPITDEVLERILKVGFQAPFAAQLCSIIYTRDTEKIKQLQRMGAYPTTQVLMFFLIDLRRLEKIMAQRGHSYDADDAFTLWLGVQDASLVAENIILAAEALGLGSVLLGATPHFADKLAEMFNIPDRVFPMVGLCLGYPDPAEHTEVRPRFPLEFSAYKDAYYNHSEEDIQTCMKVMNEGYLAQNYYIERNAKIPLRKGKDDIDYDTYSWCEHISRKFCQGGWAKYPLLATLRKQGFNFETKPKK
ncbi:MAG: nitroreductase family protein [Candidatus Hermodarchaeia archaeon]